MKYKMAFMLYLWGIITLLVSSCSEKRNTGGKILNHINLSLSFPKKEFTFQELGKVEYVKLQTEDDILLDNNSSLIHVSDKYFVFTNKKQGTVFVFSKNGEIVHSLNRKGEGGEEYRNIHNIFFDEIRNEIYIANRLQTSKILVYTIDGSYKRTLPLTTKEYKIYDYDMDCILLYDETGLKNHQYTEMPYFLISKDNGDIIDTLDICLPERYSTRNTMNVTINGQSYMQPLLLHLYFNPYRGNELVLADISSDTMYVTSSNRKLQPILTKAPSVH